MRRHRGRFTNRSCHVIRRFGLIGGRITFERRTVQANESAKMLMVLETSWLTGLNLKTLHGLFG
jgi:hypothetical protein